MIPPIRSAYNAALTKEKYADFLNELNIPHPGAIEKSIGKEETKELAVMVDTFRPLYITEDALKLEDKQYYKSWLPD